MTFEDKAIMETPIKKSIGSVITPVYLPLKDIQGANYVTLKMESDKQEKIVIFAYNCIIHKNMNNAVNIINFSKTGY